MDQLAAGTRGELRNQSVAGGAVRRLNPDLDELVIVQRAGSLGADRLGQAVLTELDHRLESVRPTPQITGLFFA